MKLSAFVLATIPVVATSQSALASEPTANWLKESVASFKKTTPAARPVARPAASKISHSSAPTAASLKLRPFVPNRYLPSEAELRQALISQQGRVDVDAQNAEASSGLPLQARVSTNQAYEAPPASAYDQLVQKLPETTRRVIKQAAAARQAITRAPQAIPGQQMMMPEQFAGAPNVMPMIPEPPRPNLQVLPDFSMPPAMQQNVSSFKHSMPQQGQMRQARPVVEAPNLSAAEAAEMDRMVAANMPQYPTEAFNGETPGSVMDNPSNGAGPPPFPMNIFAGQGGMPRSAGMRRGDTHQARFGAWHGGHSGLPQAGFHTYIARRNSPAYTYVRAGARKVQRYANTKKAAAPRPVVVAQAQPKAMTYPAYQTRAY